MRKQDTLVRYVPGQADGSPVWVRPHVAVELMEADVRTLMALQDVGERVRAWPYIERGAVTF